MRRLACWVTPLYQADSSGGAAAVDNLGRAFDIWLERKLHDMFDSTSLEPLPADLLSLVHELSKKDAPPTNEP
jgi:hypothetical protein